MTQRGGWYDERAGENPASRVLLWLAYVVCMGLLRVLARSGVARW